MRERLICRHIAMCCRNRVINYAWVTVSLVILLGIGYYFFRSERAFFQIYATAVILMHMLDGCYCHRLWKTRIQHWRCLRKRYVSIRRNAQSTSQDGPVFFQVPAAEELQEKRILQPI